MILQIVALDIFMLVWLIYRVQQFLKKKQPKLAGFYACLMGICMVVSTLLIANVDLLKTTIPVKMIFEPIGKMILKQ